MEHLLGQMGGNTLDNGWMVNNMEKESLLKLVGKVDMENGRTAKELNGSNLENRYVIENFSQINYKFIFNISVPSF